MRTNVERNSRRPSRPLGALIATGGCAAAVGLMMIFSGALAGGVHVPGNTRVIAPYNGTVNSSAYSSTTGACSKARVVTPPFFSLSSGRGGFDGSASAKFCKGGNSAVAESIEQFLVLVKIPFHPGTPTIYANVTYAMRGHLAFAAGICKLPTRPSYSACDRIAETDLFGYAFLIDQTAGTYLYPRSNFPSTSNWTLNDTSCSPTTCSNSTSGTSGPISMSGAFSLLFTPPSKMVKTHKYVFELSMSGDEYVSFIVFNAALSGASGSASMNFATLGTGAVLTSIVET